jgi:hypothetical protein
MDMKRHMLMCLAYPCRWLGERREIIRFGRSKCEWLTQKKNSYKCKFYQSILVSKID